MSANSGGKANAAELAEGPEPEVSHVAQPRVSWRTHHDQSGTLLEMRALEGQSP